MRYNQTADEIANTVRMMRSLHSGSILIVEGDPDKTLYDRFINRKLCKTTYAGGREKAIDALDILEKDNFVGIMIILDSDFLKLDNINLPSRNILLTDTHDLETMILSSGAFQKILSELGDSEKIGTLSVPVLNILLRNALPIGCLRWISSPNKEDLKLKFDRLMFQKFIDKNSLTINIDNLITDINNSSSKPISDKSSIKQKINKIIDKQHDPLQICSGHDIVQILTMGLKHIFGKNKFKRISPDFVESALRIAYEFKHFCQSQLFESIKKWEEINLLFKILEVEH